MAGRLDTPPAPYRLTPGMSPRRLAASLVAGIDDARLAASTLDAFKGANLDAFNGVEILDVLGVVITISRALLPCAKAANGEAANMMVSDVRLKRETIFMATSKLELNGRPILVGANHSNLRHIVACDDMPHSIERLSSNSHLPKVNVDPRSPPSLKLIPIKIPCQFPDKVFFNPEPTSINQLKLPAVRPDGQIMPAKPMVISRTSSRRSGNQP